MTEIEDFCRALEDAVIKFTLEVYRATGDLRRASQGEEMLGPVFLSESEWKVKHYRANARKGNATRARSKREDS